MKLNNNFNSPAPKKTRKEKWPNWPEEGFLYNGKTVWLCLSDLTFYECKYVIEHATDKVIEHLFDNQRLRERENSIANWFPTPFNGWSVWRDANTNPTGTGVKITYRIDGEPKDKELEAARERRLSDYRDSQKITLMFDDEQKRITFHPWTVAK